MKAMEAELASNHDDLKAFVDGRDPQSLISASGCIRPILA